MAAPLSTVRIDPPPARSARFDLLRWPVVGRFLRWRHARTAMQLVLFTMAALIIFDGLFGPQLAPKNLATVSVWLHYRGLVVLALLVAGNLFCMACPFMLPRQLGRWLRERFLGGGKTVPRRLRNKWVAVALLVAFFYVYERFSLWASPWFTAWIVVGYFLAAFVIDTLFRGAAFCKYVCPLGQFNMVSSLVSPLEVKVRQPAVCAQCETKDCITAGPERADRLGQGFYRGTRGCELWLFQERKTGNMDCTFCLDCIHACPYDNVGILARVPASELLTDRFRAGIGYLSRRTDLAALVAVLVFSGFVNAFAMIRPVYALRERLSVWLGSGSQEFVLLLMFALGLIVLPAALLALAGLSSRYLGREHRTPVLAIIRRDVYALVPLGFGMWLAHYSFHFLTGALTIVPVIQSFLADIGLYRGLVQWELGPLVPMEWLYPIEAMFLYLGASGSLIVAFQLAVQRHGPTERGRVLGAALPWLLLTLLLLGIGLWIMVQPMEMRGTMMAASAQ